jgi:hypothetical protein
MVKDNLLPEFPYGVRPKVILVGNGLNRSFEKAVTTDEIIQKEWFKQYKTNLPDRNAKPIHKIWKLPLPMQVVAATKDHVQTCMEELADTFKKLEISQEQIDFIRNILDTGVDAVLTTNYSLEFEKSTIENFTQNKAYHYYKKPWKQNKRQEQFGIHQCTELPYANLPLVWHIHGTALRKNSLIMGQLYYGQLLSEVTKRAAAVNKKYKKVVSQKLSYRLNSWIDYFLIGDVHIFGFGLDFSESDLWWLLSYKKNKFPEAKTYFYGSDITDELRLMLECYKVEIPNTPVMEKSGADRYINFYKAICEKIKNETDK